MISSKTKSYVSAFLITLSGIQLNWALEALPRIDATSFSGAWILALMVIWVAGMETKDDAK